MNLWKLQSQWDSEHDRKNARYERMVVKKQKDNIITDIGITLLIFVVLFVLYVTLPGFEQTSPGMMP